MKVVKYAMKFGLLWGIFLLGSANAESISNNLASTTLGTWMLGTNRPYTGSPVPPPPGYSGDYIVAPPGTDEFHWEVKDGQNGIGTVTYWIYDSARNLEAEDLGLPQKGPYWGMCSDRSGCARVGIVRIAYVGWNQGFGWFDYNFGFGYSWFKDGLRGSYGVPWNAGWYKWTTGNYGFTIHDVDYLEGGGGGTLVHGDVTRSFGYDKSDRVIFKGDGNGGTEDIYIAVVGGTGNFAGVGNFTPTGVFIQNNANKPTLSDFGILIVNNPLVLDNIQLSLTSSLYLKISLQSVLGQTHLLGHQQFKAGTHELLLPNKISKGIYFLKIDGEDFSEVKKVVVVR